MENEKQKHVVVIPAWMFWFLVGALFGVASLKFFFEIGLMTCV